MALGGALFARKNSRSGECAASIGENEGKQDSLPRVSKVTGRCVQARHRFLRLLRGLFSLGWSSCWIRDVSVPRLVDLEMTVCKLWTRQSCGTIRFFFFVFCPLTHVWPPPSLPFDRSTSSSSFSLSLSLSGLGGKNNNDDNSTSPTKGGEEASTSAPAASPSPRRRLFGGSRSRSRSPSPGATSPTTIAASNPSTKLAARASAASPSPHSKYAPLTLDQAAAIDENAAAITRRVDAKARKVRGEAAARLFLYLALAALALRLVGPRFGAVVGAILGLAYGQFLRGSVARQWATRRRTHATVARARAALAAAALGGERAAAARSRFDGTWYRDAAASDSMDRALDVMAIRGIVRKAIALVKGLVLKVDCSNGPGSSGLFTLQVFSVIPILKITERYPLTGAPVEHRRRDLRSGRAAGSTELLADGRLRTTLVWEGSKPGSGTDAYEVSADGRTLTVSSFLKVGGETASYRVVYRKAE